MFAVVLYGVKRCAWLYLHSPPNPGFAMHGSPSMARVAVVRSLYFFGFPGQVVVGLDIGCWRNASVKRCQVFDKTHPNPSIKLSRSKHINEFTPGEIKQLKTTRCGSYPRVSFCASQEKEKEAAAAAAAAELQQLRQLQHRNRGGNDTQSFGSEGLPRSAQGQQLVLMKNV